MLTLRDPASVDQVHDPSIRAFLSQRFRDLSVEEPYDPDVNGHFVLIEPGEDMATIEAETGCWLVNSPFSGARFGDHDYSPCFELLEEHPACFELVFVFNDGDYGIVLVIPKADGINSELLHFCIEFATPA